MASPLADGKPGLTASRQLRAAAEQTTGAVLPAAGPSRMLDTTFSSPSRQPRSGTRRCHAILPFLVLAFARASRLVGRQGWTKTCEDRLSCAGLSKSHQIGYDHLSRRRMPGRKRTNILFHRQTRIRTFGPHGLLTQSPGGKSDVRPKISRLGTSRASVLIDRPPAFSFGCSFQPRPW